MTCNETLIREARATIFTALNRLQFGDADRLLIMRPLPIGLGGQISMRLETLRLALALDRKAIFPFLADRPYTQIFVQMNAPVGTDHTQSAPEVDPRTEQVDRVLSFDRMITGPEHFTDDVYRQILARLTLPALPEMVVDGLILEWMKPLAETQHFVDADAARLGVSGTTLGVHFRRGDKSVETAYVPEAEFNAQIRAMHARWSFTELFLASDDPAAADKIVPPEGVRLVFDHTEVRFNNANHKMLIRNPKLAEQETRVAYKNIALLARCGGIIGLDNAHFSTLASRAIQARGLDRERIVLIDGRFAEKRSPWLKLAFDAKRRLRAVARTVFRSFTIRERMNRSEHGRHAS